MVYRLGDNDRSVGLVAFDLSVIPQGVTVTSAKLRLYQMLATGESTVEIWLARTYTDWQETTVKWSNDFSYAPITKGFVPSDINKYYEYTVTETVGTQLQYSTKKINFYIFHPSWAGRSTRLFTSRESTHPPQLVVNYLPSPSATPTPSPTLVPLQFFGPLSQVNLLAPSESDQTSPVISDTTVGEMTPFQAVVSWKTDEPATSRVDFGLDANYGTTVNNSDLVTNHTITIQGLSSVTSYHFQVRSSDVAGNESFSGDFYFTTEAAFTDYLPDEPTPTTTGIMISPSKAVETTLVSTDSASFSATAQGSPSGQLSPTPKTKGESLGERIKGLINQTAFLKTFDIIVIVVVVIASAVLLVILINPFKKLKVNQEKGGG